jgi:hypothetical protein
MASTINGTSTGNGGLISTGDDSGILNIQTNETTAISIDASQNTTFAGKVTSAGALTLASNGTTTAVTIDTSQNVLVGTTTSANNIRLNQKLAVITAGSGNFGGINNTSYNGTSAGAGPIYDMQRSRGTTDGSMTAVASGDTLGYVVFRGSDGAGFVDSSYITGQVDGAVGSGSVPGRLVFNTSGTERMRINSSGNVILGSNTSTTANNVLNLWSPTSTLNGIYMQKNAQVEVQMGFKASTNTDFYIGTGSTTMGTYGVYLANTGNSWTSVSDERQKDIIEPIQNGLTKVNALRAVIGKYKHDADGVRRSFLIAQDVQAVFPEAVKVQEDEEALLGLSYTDVIPLLVASIKELKAINDTQAKTLTQQTEAINALTARVVALESK